MLHVTEPQPLRLFFINSLGSGGKMWRSTVLRHPRQTSYASLLVKTVAYQSGVAGLYLRSLLALCVGEPVSDFTPGTLEVLNQQHVSNVGTLTKISEIERRLFEVY